MLIFRLGGGGRCALAQIFKLILAIDDDGFDNDNDEAGDVLLNNHDIDK